MVGLRKLTKYSKFTIPSYSFSNSALVSLFIKWRGLENLKKFSRKHMKEIETMVLSQIFCF